MADFPTVFFPQDFALNISVEEEMPNNDVVTRTNKRYPVPLRDSPFKRLRIAYGPKNQQGLNKVRDIFHIAQGTTHTFRIICPQDSTSSNTGAAPTMLDQEVGIGDGTTELFQIVKNHVDGIYTFNRHITNLASLQVAVNGVLSTGYTLNSALGRIDFTSPPANGAVITAGFTYYLKVRFADQNLLQQFITHKHAEFDEFTLEVEDD